MEKPFVWMSYILGQDGESCVSIYTFKMTRTDSSSITWGPQPSKCDSISSWVDGTTQGCPGRGPWSSPVGVLSVEKTTMLTYSLP